MSIQLHSLILTDKQTNKQSIYEYREKEATSVCGKWYLCLIRIPIWFYLLYLLKENSIPTTDKTTTAENY